MSLGDAHKIAMEHLKKMQQSTENKGEELAKKEVEIKKKLEAIWTIDPKATKSGYIEKFTKNELGEYWLKRFVEIDVVNHELKVYALKGDSQPELKIPLAGVFILGNIEKDGQVLDSYFNLLVPPETEHAFRCMTEDDKIEWTLYIKKVVKGN